MNDSKKPLSKETKIALGFTAAVHVVAITGLLFLGMTQHPEPHKQIKTILIKPEDLIPPEPKPLVESDATQTAHENVQADIQQTAEPVQDAPNIPTVAPPLPKVDTAQKQALAAEQKAAEQKAVQAAKAAEQAKANAAQKEREAKADANNKAKAEAAAQAKAEAAQKAKQEAAQRAKAEATKARQDALNKAKADAAEKAKRDATAKAKTDSANKAKADAAAKAKTDAANKAKADAAAKAKTEAANKAKADAEAKERAAEEARASSAQKAKEEAANKKAEARKIASSAKRDFENKVKNAWRMPLNSSGQRATARVNLSDSGSVTSVVVNASDPDVKASVEQAVRAAAPYPMPSDPDARSQARSFTASFTVK